MKKIVFIAIVITIVFCLVSCEQIEDTNGSDNTDLCQLTMDDITGVKHSFTTVKSSSKTKFNSRLKKGYHKVYGMHEDEDVDYKRMKGGPCSGTSVLMATQLDSEQDITFSVAKSIETGNLQVFLLSPSKEIIHEFKDENSSHNFITKEEGKHIIMIGAESFVGQIEVERYFE